MVSKKSRRKSKPSRNINAFNRSQEIYKLLEKGIVESDALLGSTRDRPEEDAHVSDLLEENMKDNGRLNVSFSRRKRPVVRHPSRNRNAKKKAVKAKKSKRRSRRR